MCPGLNGLNPKNPPPEKPVFCFLYFLWFWVLTSKESERCGHDASGEDGPLGGFVKGHLGGESTVSNGVAVEGEGKCSRLFCHIRPFKSFPVPFPLLNIFLGFVARFLSGRHFLFARVC